MSSKAKYRLYQVIYADIAVITKGDDMKENVNFYRFEDAFRKMDRNNNFTYEGKQALFDYLEELEEGTGEEIELDIIAICCDYTEYESIEELKKEYDDIEDMDDLRDRTFVIEFDEGLIIQQF